MKDGMGDSMWRPGAQGMVSCFLPYLPPRSEDTSFSLDITQELGIQLCTASRSRHAEIVGEGGVRAPLGGCARSSFLQHLVDLFESEAL